MNTLKGNDAAEEFLDNPGGDSFQDLFRIFTPQLVAFFRKRGHELSLAEDLAQEVMLTVYRKTGQLRDRSLFRAWLFQIARHTVCRHFAKLSREVPTVDLEDLGPPAGGGELSRSRECGIRIPQLDVAPGAARARRDDAALHRRMGVSRNRRGKGDTDRHGAVARFNSKKKLAAHLNLRKETVRAAA